MNGPRNEDTWTDWTRQIYGPLRFPASLLAFGLSTLPSWPTTVDDVYISIVYARRWAENGTLTWSTGERVEGYSNFLHVGLLALGARLGLDVDVLAQLLALGAGVTVLLCLHRTLPRTAAGTLTLLGVSAWAPLGRWASIGMETTVYAALVVWGWSLLFARRQAAAGVALLALASMTRPEGALQLAAGLAVMLVSPSARAWRSAVLVLAGLLAYHVARVSWFGELLPTSYLVKVSPIGLTPYGVLQFVGDLVTASGILLALGVAVRLSTRDLAWALLPLLIQGATLVRASGDWMAWARLSLPGVLGTVAAAAVLGAQRGPAGRVALVLTATLVAAASWLEPRGYGSIDIGLRSATDVAKSLLHLRRGLDTPIAEDVRWVIDHVPVGASGLVVDAGMLGDIPGFRLIDMRGLTHRPAAEAIASGNPEGWLRSTVARPDRPAFLRLASWDTEIHSDYPEWLIGPYALRADLRYGGGSIRWYSTTSARPTAEERAARWDEVLRRHPSHPFLAWHASLSAAATGDLTRALAISERAARKWPALEHFRDTPASLSFTDGTRALEWRDGGFIVACGDSVTSRRLIPGEELRIVAVPKDFKLMVDDPCQSEARVVASGDHLLSCQTAREVSITLLCSDGERRLTIEP